MNPPPPVSLALTELGIAHNVFIHTNQVMSLEQAATERNQRPEQVVRSIIFRLSKGEYLMVLMAGPRQIDWKSLRQHLGTSRVSMASKDEVLAATGYQLGAVAPFGLPQPIRILADRSVLAEEELSMGSGVRNVAILLKSADLMQALGDVEIGSFCGEDCD
jgi:Cys-tRNA(Pro) deacylase